MNTLTLGRELARRRAIAGLSQAELAKRMGSSQASISKIENGRAVPTLSTLERFARLTGGAFAVIVGDEPQDPSREELRRRVRRVSGDFEFNPWDREPTEAEAASLIADGLTREYFEGRDSPS